MHTTKIEKDFKVVYIAAESFPEGAQAAHQKLHGLIKFDPTRNYFGISNPDKTGKIIYKACAKEFFNGELNHLKLNEQIVPAGNYLYIDVANFRNNIEAIGEAFYNLTHDKHIDPMGFCLEWYLDNDVCRCMVKTK